MINKLKIGLLVMVLSLAFGVTANAADLTFTDNMNVTVNSIPLIIGAGSTATSVAINGTTLTAVVPASSTFNLIAPGGNLLTNDLTLAQNCSLSSNSVTVSGPLTVVFTPSASVCTPPSGGGGLSSGGGSSGSTTTTTTTTAPTTPVVTGSGSTATPAVTLSITPVSIIAGCEGRTTGFSTVSGLSCTTNLVTYATIAGCMGTSGFSTVTGQSCVNNVGGVTISAGGNTALLLTANVSKKSSKSAVMTLQAALNRALGANLSVALVVDGLWGAKTTAAVKAFQTWAHLSADGVVGPMTRAALNLATQ